MPHRPLSAASVVLLAVLTIVGMELWTQRVWHSEGGLLEKARNFATNARAEDKNLLILGTCLPAQHIRTPQLQAALGEGWSVYNLGQEATNALDWYLAYANEIPADRVSAVVVAYGEADLLVDVSPWESRVLEVARWSDMPELAGYACPEAVCRTDLYLRKASSLWRNRIRISNRIWLGLGALPRGAPEVPVFNRLGDAGPRHYLERLVSAVRAHGTPLWFLPLPRRPGGQRGEPAQPVLPQVERLEIPGLPRDMFTDETHLTEPGSLAVTAATAQVLREALAVPGRP